MRAIGRAASLRIAEPALADLFDAAEPGETKARILSAASRRPASLQLRRAREILRDPLFLRTGHGMVRGASRSQAVEHRHSAGDCP